MNETQTAILRVEIFYFLATSEKIGSLSNDNGDSEDNAY